VSIKIAGKSKKDLLPGIFERVEELATNPLPGSAAWKKFRNAIAVSAFLDFDRSRKHSAILIVPQQTVEEV
jgi:hypothetical protein